MTRYEFYKRLAAYDPKRDGDAREYLWKLFYEHAVLMLLSVYGAAN